MLFTLDKNNVTISPSALLLLPFKEIWESDKSIKKETALKELAFIYYTTDFKSPYQEYSDKDLADKVKLAVGLPNNWKPSAAVLLGKELYSELQITRSLKFVQGARNAIDKMIEFFDNVDFTLLDDKGQPVYKITDLVRTVKESHGMLDSLKKLEQQVKNEIEAKGTSRGGFSIGDFED